MTGEKIGDRYAVEVVEAHHIKPFTESLNNDTANITSSPRRTTASSMRPNRRSITALSPSASPTVSPSEFN